jgi:hypothetical protein
MTVEARARCGDVLGSEGGVGLLREASSMMDTPAVIGAATDERPDRNALTNGLAVEKTARGSLVAFAPGGSGVTKFVVVGCANLADDNWSRVGSIRSSPMQAGDDGL